MEHNRMACSLKTMLLLVLFPSLCLAGDWKEIPVKDGKVVFSDTVAIIENTKEFNENLPLWLNDFLFKNNGYVVSNDTVNHLIVCRTIGILELEKGALSSFSLYMKCTLNIQYFGDKWIVEIRDLTYSELDKKNTVITAEYIFVDKKYRVSFVKDATNKIAVKTIERMDEIFAKIRKHITKERE
jgi:hypothetical protein